MVEVINNSVFDLGKLPASYAIHKKPGIFQRILDLVASFFSRFTQGSEPVGQVDSYSAYFPREMERPTRISNLDATRALDQRIERVVKG